MTSRASAPPPSRPALSRQPRWVTVLGLVLVLCALAVAALVAKGLIGRAIGGHGGMRTVVLRVDHVPVQGIPCSPYCAPMVYYATPTGGRTYWGDTNDHGASLLPFTKTVQVRAGGTVTLHAEYAGDESITCSITVNGQVLSKNTNNFIATTAAAADCQSVIP